VDAGQPAIQPVVIVGQPFVIEAQQMENRGIEIPNRGGIDFGPTAKLVGCAVADARLNACAHHPTSKAIGIVVAAGRSFLASRHPTEFGRPENERIF